MRHTFKAYERLKREQHINTLFRTGKAYSVFPLKLVYLLRERSEGESSPVRAGFSIPKKKFRRAVDRNRIKRLIREAWRLNKHELYELVPAEQQLHLFFIYTHTEKPDFDTITKTVIRAADHLKLQFPAHA